MGRGRDPEPATQSAARAAARHPGRDRSLRLGRSAVYLHVLPVDAIRHTDTLATDAARKLLGDRGARFISMAIVVSTFGFIDMTLLTAPASSTPWAGMGICSRPPPTFIPSTRPRRHADLLRGLDQCRVPGRLLRRAAELHDLRRLDLLRAGRSGGVHAAAAHARFAAAVSRLGLSRILPALFVLAAFAFVLVNFVANQPQTSYGLAMILSGIPAFYFFQEVQCVRSFTWSG